MHLFFHPIADSYRLVAVIAVALMALVVLIGPGRERVPPGRRAVLALIRCGIVLLVVVGMLRPRLIYTQTRQEHATLVVLIDQSQSMQIPDGANGKSRWESLRATLEECVPALRALGRDFEIKVHTFDAETHPLEIKDGKVVLSAAPPGLQTAIGAALGDVLNQENGKRLLGIVLLTDGRQQAPAPRDAAPQDVAAKLRFQGYAVYPVVFGQSRGLGGAQDVAVTSFPTPAAVFVKTEMAIHGELRINGYLNRPITVRALMESPEGRMEVVAEKQVKAETDGQLVPVDFSCTPEVAGEFKLILEAVTQPGELVTTNNRRVAFVQVLKGGLHVLYIEGAIRVEQKFLRRSLDASRDIKVDAVRLDPRHKETRPPDLAELLKPGKYDVYILGDVDSTAFQPKELEQLKATVSAGKGLIMLGGFNTFGPGGYYDTALADVLPMRMDRTERQLLGDTIREDVHLPGPVRMTPTPREVNHFVLALAAGAKENAEAWAKLPPLDGANRFNLNALKPDAAVLAEANGREQDPILVTQTYGSGRVIAFAGDSTWRWWMRGFESAHKRFWRQIVLWLARKDQMNQGNVWVRLDNTTFTPGSRVEFTAGAQSPQNEPLPDAEFSAEVIKPDTKRTPVVTIRREDHRTGSFRETQLPGDYTIEVAASHQGEPLGKARARFNVPEQDSELENASADSDSMKVVAKSSGGEPVEPERLARFLERLSQQAKVITETTDETASWNPWERKQAPWDVWPYFVTIVAALSVEWYLRKRWGLV